MQTVCRLVIGAFSILASLQAVAGMSESKAAEEWSALSNPLEGRIHAGPIRNGTALPLNETGDILPQQLYRVVQLSQNGEQDQAIGDTSRNSTSSRNGNANGSRNDKGKDNDNGGKAKFAGISFGVGISLTTDLGRNDRIGSASLVDGIVRVQDRNNLIPRVMLEAHYFFKPDNKWQNVPKGEWGHGPFVAIQPGSSEIIEAIALGWMIGFKQPGDDDSDASWNLGLGIVIDPNVNVLGTDIVANEPLPGEETEIRLREVGQVGVLLISSFSF